MLALIMAGGSGIRLGMGEKPLVTICGVPMIQYIIDAFEGGGYEVVVVASRKTPYTLNWCRGQGIPLFRAGGGGYVEDIIEAVSGTGEDGQLFTCVSDIPCLKKEIIRHIDSAYRESGTPALSTWVPHSLCITHMCRTQYTERIDGVTACPAGINILRGDLITETQEERKLLVTDNRLVFNINTRKELTEVRRFLCRERRRTTSG